MVHFYVGMSDLVLLGSWECHYDLETVWKSMRGIPNTVVVVIGHFAFLFVADFLYKLDFVEAN